MEEEGALFWNMKKVIRKGDYNYAIVPEHPNATKNGYVLEHRIVMENHLGRLLHKNEVIHHKDRNKKNNNIHNLELTNQSSHARNHQLAKGKMYAKLKCPNCNVLFEKSHNLTFLVRGGKFTCCSCRCRGIFSATIQYGGITKQVEDAISANIQEIYRKFQDNTEET